MNDHLPTGAVSRDISFYQCNGGLCTAGRDNRILKYGKVGNKVKGTGRTAQHQNHSVRNMLKSLRSNIDLCFTFFIFTDQEWDFEVDSSRIQNVVAIFFSNDSSGAQLLQISSNGWFTDKMFFSMMATEIRTPKSALAGSSSPTSITK